MLVFSLDKEPLGKELVEFGFQCRVDSSESLTLFRCILDLWDMLLELVLVQDKFLDLFQHALLQQVDVAGRPPTPTPLQLPGKVDMEGSLPSTQRIPCSNKASNPGR